MAKKKTLTKAEIAKADRLLKDTYKDVLDPTTKKNKKYKEKILKKLRKAGIKIGLAGLTGPVGLLAAGISEAAAATPAGDPDELKKLKVLEAAGFKPTEAGRKRAVPGASKRGGGKIKKNYSKGGGVRLASY